MFDVLSLRVINCSIPCVHIYKLNKTRNKFIHFATKNKIFYIQSLPTQVSRAISLLFYPGTGGIDELCHPRRMVRKLLKLCTISVVYRF